MTSFDRRDGAADWLGHEDPVRDLARQIAAPWADRVGAAPDQVEVWADPETMETYNEEVRGVFRGLAEMLRTHAAGEPKPWTGMEEIRAWRDRVADLPAPQQTLIGLADALDDAVDASYPGGGPEDD